ncbi:MAG TPA: diguanylate cyclase [Gemmatimonadales bacterium]|nr:diguanylate cyclase [Gemmatimonadales bacterium]
MSSLTSIFSNRRVLRLDTVRSKILVFAILVTLFPTGITAWISYSQNRRALEEKISQELLSASGQSAREMDVWLKERLYDLRVFASSYEVTENLTRGGKRKPDRARLNDYLNSVRERLTDYEELIVLDPRGWVVGTSAKELRALKLPPDWSRELSSEEALIGDAAWDQALGKAVLLVAVPVQRADGRMTGALAARLNLRGAEEGLRAFAPSNAGRMYLMATDGSLIASSGASSAGFMKSKLDQKTLDRLKAREGSVVGYRSIAGTDVVGSLKRVPRVRWAILAEIPADSAYWQVLRFRNMTFLIVGGLLLAVSGIAYRLGILIARPLERLTKGAAEVANGDLAVDLPAAKGEVGDLTAVFNHMVERLRHGRQELDAVNEKLRRQNEELERISTVDALTGLHNRRFLTQRLSNELVRSYREKCSFTVLMADVDEFKKYNDAFGHPAGDEVLKKVANILLGSTRAVDCTARYGGEEFAVLLADTVGEGALQVAERIRERVAAESFPGRKITISIGMAEFPVHGHTADAVISRADEALYAAKRAGRNRIERAGPERTRVKGEA